MKVKEVLRRLRADGWVQIKAKGSHRQFKHPANSAIRWLLERWQASSDKLAGTRRNDETIRDRR
jgi:hypothetical protein